MQMNSMASNQLLRLPSVILMIGLSRSSIYSLIKSGSFPPGIKLSERAIAWQLSDIQNWISKRIALKSS